MNRLIRQIITKQILVCGFSVNTIKRRIAGGSVSIVVDVQILFVQTISISFFTQIQLQFHCLISFKKIKILGRLIGIVAVVDLRLMTWKFNSISQTRCVTDDSYCSSWSLKMPNYFRELYHDRDDALHFTVKPFQNFLSSISMYISTADDRTIWYMDPNAFIV